MIKKKWLFLYSYQLTPKQLSILINGNLFYNYKQNPNQVVIIGFFGLKKTLHDAYTYK